MVNPAAKSGDDGSDLTNSNFQGYFAEKTGIHALEKADLFNLLCIPPLLSWWGYI
jgi:hypothetical protein